MNVTSLIIFFSSVVFFLISFKQYHDYNESLIFCRKQRVSDQDLIRNPLCVNFENHVLHGTNNAIDCTISHKRLHIPVRSCAWNRWFGNMDILRVWNMLTENYIKASVFFGVIIILTIYFTINAIFRERNSTYFYEKQFELVKLMHAKQNNNPFAITETTTQRKRIRGRRRYNDRSLA